MNKPRVPKGVASQTGGQSHLAHEQDDAVVGNL